MTEQAWPTDTVPVVSILCITYNHEKFISECLDGFLMQKTTFPVEVLIHDDASTDATADIIREYEGQFPHIIKPIYQTENQYSKGVKPNPTFNIPRAKGKYIAICEGDDYWTDPLKLQKQVDFLEANPDFSICFHKVKILKDGQLIDDYITKVPRFESTLLDLVAGNYIHTLSCVCKNRGFEVLGSNFRYSPIGDYYFHCMNAQYGKIYYINETMAVYRAHDQSVWSNKSYLYRQQKTQEARKVILKDLSKDHADAINVLAKCHINTAYFLYRDYREEFSLEDLIITDFPAYTLQLASLLFDSYSEIKAKESELKEIKERQHSLSFVLKRLVLIVKMKLSNLKRTVRENVRHYFISNRS
ncbi:glycosyltransferase [Nitrosococcus wardiae]|uniref:Glycosyltransferase n=1 Tax=Nitrosococcus wardiae TaxID=1814290 RepID=A0A4P7C4E7_9GAMM|nr:glycosyltransferase [Nitrosococcus wardiae]